MFIRVFIGETDMRPLITNIGNWIPFLSSRDSLIFAISESGFPKQDFELDKCF